MKPIDVKAIRDQRCRSRTGWLPMLMAFAVSATTQASTVLVSDTTLVTGSESQVFSFNAPGPGTVSVQLTNLDWPQALSSLSFVATTANNVLSSWSNSASAPGPQDLTFQIRGPGTYFADVMATAGGPLDLGLYSLSLSFTPAGSAVVPVPSSGGLLLVGSAALIGLLRWARAKRDRLVISPPRLAAAR